MKEFIKANGAVFECSAVTTGTDSITLTMAGQDADYLGTFFGGVAELEAAYEKPEEPGENRNGPVLEEPHGTFKNLVLKDVVYHAEDGSASVVMRIKTKTEIQLEEMGKRLDELEAGQEVQDASIGRLEMEEKQRSSLKLS